MEKNHMCNRWVASHLPFTSRADVVLPPSTPPQPSTSRDAAVTESGRRHHKRSRCNRVILAVGCASAPQSHALFGGSSGRSTLPIGVNLRDGATYDYIVVGGGGAGAAAATRLALAGHDVLLVEAGGDPDLISTVPGASSLLLGGPLDWQYETLPNNVSCLAYRKRQCRFSRGKCLGGSTSTNYMMYTRGSPKDFDELNISGWAWEDVKPYFLKYEGLKDLAKLPSSSIPYHNTTGTMEIEFFTDSGNAWHPRIVDGFKELNFPYNPDVNAQSQIGVSQIVGYVYDNVRMSTARGYLARKDVKIVLKVAKSTTCTGVIVDANNTAKGVTAITGLFRRKVKVYARKEVILSAGTIGTPQILMLSGIGPAEHLKQFNISVKADLPVGENMADHLLPLIFVKVKSENQAAAGLLANGIKLVTDIAELLLLMGGPLASNGLTDVTAFINSDCYDYEARQLRNDSAACELATLHFVHAYIDKYLMSIGKPLAQQGTDLNDDVMDQLADLNADYGFITMTPVVLQPRSRGWVRLASADPSVPPAILPNFLADERDLDEMVRAATIIEHLMETKPFKDNNASIVILDLPGCPDYPSDRQGYWRCYSRHMTHTVYHAVGSASLGPVLDEELRVRGVESLRVADLSAMPKLPRANTAATAIAIGERVADFILNSKS